MLSFLKKCFYFGYPAAKWCTLFQVFLLLVAIFLLPWYNIPLHVGFMIFHMWLNYNNYKVDFPRG